MEHHTAKHFVLQLGSLASLYLSLSLLLVLLFGIINLLVPDATDSAWQLERHQSTVRIGIAFVVVFFPTYLILTRIVNRTRRDEPDGAYLGLTRWLIYLSLLVGGAALLGDLVAVIMAFLEGEITLRFILKALAVLVVVGAAFGYYILDARGHWLTHESTSRLCGLIASGVVLAAVVGGFFAIEGPNTARDRVLDEQQVRDLQQIQYEVQQYLNRNGKLPASQNDLPRNITGFDAPEDRPNYTYSLTDDGFELCATFATPSRETELTSYSRPLAPSDSTRPVIVNPDDWTHETGETCFERTVSSTAKSDEQQSD